jgi:hypothetical protein
LGRFTDSVYYTKGGGGICEIGGYVTRPSVVPAIMCAGGLHGEVAEGTNREGHTGREGRRILGWLRRKTQGIPQGRAPNPEQSGDFAGRFLSTVDLFPRVVDLLRREFPLRAKLHTSALRGLHSGFRALDNHPRSNSASKATMCSIARPSGFLVSICSVML